MNSQKDRRGGFYFHNGKPYVSVTRCLQSIAKPQLLFWAARETYRAILNDPSIEEASAVNAHLGVKNKAADRGKLIHSLVEAYKTSGTIVKTVPEEVKGYIEGFYKWVRDSMVVIEDQEKTVLSEKHRYGGTLDLLVKMNGSASQYVVDVKTNKDGVIYPEHHLQVSAYLQALREAKIEVGGGAILCLTQDGRYSFHQVKDNLAPFLACKELFVWQNEDLCKRVGYI